MIIFEKPFEGRQCNVCHKQKDIVEVYFKSDFNNSGICVALCRECRATLRTMLDMFDLPHIKQQTQIDPHSV